MYLRPDGHMACKFQCKDTTSKQADGMAMDSHRVYYV